MNQEKKGKLVALVRREMQEYRNSFVLIPLAVAGVLIACMLVSVLVANRITVAGESMIDILHDEHSGSGMNITISIDEDQVRHDYIISQEPPGQSVDQEDWNFSKEWKFNPQRSERVADEPDVLKGSLNPVLNGLHCLFLLLLLATSINYLLATFHQERRDGSVLFWKSMPVSEVQEVVVKMAIVGLVAPLVYLLVSMAAQIASVFLAMLITWRMDMSPVQTVLGNINFLTLFRGQVSGLLIWVAWTAPFYAWLLLCSAAARRSPLTLALGIPIGLIVLEQLFIGSEIVADSISNHVPHPGVEDGSPMGFYFYEPDWLSLDYPGMLLGLIVAAGLMVAAVWFRKHRFEI